MNLLLTQLDHLSCYLIVMAGKSTELEDHFRANLVQLHCTEVSWAAASDKVPHTIAQFILGDLYQVLHRIVFLRDNRILLDIDSKDDLIGNLETFQNVEAIHGGYRCLFSFAQVGRYPDLVHTMCNVVLHGLDQSILEEDILDNFEETKDPAFIYLSLNPARRSTPKKPTQVEQAVDVISRQDPTIIDGVVKGLIDRHGLGVRFEDQRVSSDSHGPSAFTPADSFVQASQILVREMAEKGVLRGNIPKLDIFAGAKDDKSKVAFAVWDRQVSALIPDYPESTIKVAVRNSLKGRAQEDISVLPASATLAQILGTLRTKYQIKASYDSLMSEFYSLVMSETDDCASFSSKLEQKLTDVQTLFPQKLEGLSYLTTLRDRFFHGLPITIRSNVRNEYTKGTPYYELVQAARMIESETKQDKPAVTFESGGKLKGRAQAAALNISEDSAFKKLEAAYNRSSQDIKSLQSMVQDLTSALGKIQQTPTPQPTTDSSSSQGYYPRGRGSWRGGRGFHRGRVAQDTGVSSAISVKIMYQRRMQGIGCRIVHSSGKLGKNVGKISLLLVTQILRETSRGVIF